MFNLSVAVILMSVLSAQLASASRFTSPAAAQELTHLLRTASLPAFAAADPERPGAFIAVLYVDGHLLVVEAYHPATSALGGRIRAGQYRGAYLDLQATPTPDASFFVSDVNADGLLAGPDDGAVDEIHDGDRRLLLLNGDARGHDLSEEEYNARVGEADRKYARVLQVLIDTIEQQLSHVG